MKALGLFILILAAFTVVGTMDMQDQAAEQAAYCEGVEKGWHPAYNEDIDCGENHGR